MKLGSSYESTTKCTKTAMQLYVISVKSTDFRHYIPHILIIKLCARTLNFKERIQRHSSCLIVPGCTYVH